MTQKISFIMAGMLSIFVFLGLTFSSQSVYAQLEQVCSAGGDSVLCQEHVRTQGRGGSRGLYGPGGLLTNIANLVSLIVGIASVVTIMIAGFRYIRSSGDASTTSSAQNTIIYAVIGLLVAGAGQLLVAFVLNRAV
jgi:hypothetical protein